MLYKMAAFSGKQGSGSEEEQCEETNVFSSQFDALRAIHDPSVAIPCPEAKPFEDISKFINHYNRLLDLGKVERPVNVKTAASRNVSRSSCATSTTTSTTSTKSGQTEKSETKSTTVTDTSLRQHDPSAGKVRATKPHHARSLVESQTGTSHARDQEKTRRNCTVFRLMEDAEGPLSLLRWCFENKKKARVCTRTFKGLRSVCIGFVVAFDKFFNLALSDVTEIYRKPPLGKTIYHQETLTVSKILEQFKLTQKGRQETPKKEKKWNRKERKVRLEERLKAEGVFIENYHPPPPVERGTQGQGQNEMSSTSGTVVGVKSRSNDIEFEADKAKSDKNIDSKEITERGRKTVEAKQTGKDLIKPTEFYRRYVHQLFVKGDNVVLISVDKKR